LSFPKRGVAYSQIGVAALMHENLVLPALFWNRVGLSGYTAREASPPTSLLKERGFEQIYSFSQATPPIYNSTPNINLC